MAVEQRISEEAYQQFVLSGAGKGWELHDGRLVEKPGMSWKHHDIVLEFAYLLRHQLDRSEYRVFIEGRIRRPMATIFLPDLMVVPTSYGDAIWRCHPRSSRTGNLLRPLASRCRGLVAFDGRL